MRYSYTMRHYNIIFAIIFRSRDSILRGGSCIGVRNTWKCGYFEMHHTKFCRRICIGRIVGGKRRLNLQIIY